MECSQNCYDEDKLVQCIYENLRIVDGSMLRRILFNNFFYMKFYLFILLYKTYCFSNNL